MKAGRFVTKIGNKLTHTYIHTHTDRSVTKIGNKLTHTNRHTCIHTHSVGGGWMPSEVLLS